MAIHTNIMRDVAHKQLSWADWLDRVLIEQMADELLKRRAALDDLASIRAALGEAGFGDLAINRLAETAAQAAMLAAEDARDAA